MTNMSEAVQISAANDRRKASLANLRPWKPGQSGNPTGIQGEGYREVLRLARDAAPEAARRLIELTRSPDERISLVASQAVLERAYGKPREMVADEPPPPIDVSSLNAEQVSLLQQAVTLAAQALGEVVVGGTIEGKADNFRPRRLNRSRNRAAFVGWPH
jgi:hypothetical protein